MAVLALGVFGSLIGSFLNVVVYRVPRGISVVSPPSACGSCEHPIRWFDNIPVISWLALRGRCRDCSAPISVRYPLVELAGAVFFAVVALRFVPAVLSTSAPTHTAAAVLELAAFLYLAAISSALALIDIDVRRLPNSIVLPAYLVGGALLGAAALLAGDPDSAARAAIGALALGLFYLALALLPRQAMGMGDVKLAGVLGLFLGWCGWDALVVGALAAFVLGGVVATVLLVTGRAGRRTAIPFGPWMLLGAWIGILAGAPLASGYLSLFGVGES